MNNYSIDTDARRKIYFALALISVGAALLILHFTDHSNQLFLKLAAPDAMMMFGILMWLFDKHLWKHWLFHWSTGIPVLDGDWKGTLTRRDKNGEPVKRDVTLTITQTWLTMNIVFEGEKSESTSKVIAFNIADKRKIVLKWIYFSKNRTGIEEANLYGEGTTEVTLKTTGGNRKLIGMYYSSKLQQGSLELNENTEI
jgi:hypothetical protein